MDGWNRIDAYNILANPYTTTRPAMTLGARQHFTQVGDAAVVRLRQRHDVLDVRLCCSGSVQRPAFGSSSGATPARRATVSLSRRCARSRVDRCRRWRSITCEGR